MFDNFQGFDSFYIKACCKLLYCTAVVHEHFDSLKKRTIPVEQLVVIQTLSRELSKYSVSTPLFLAAKQLEVQGKAVKRGNPVRYVYMARSPSIHAWDLPNEPDLRGINVIKYRELAFLATYEVLQPLGITERVLKA
jgi:DNA polymerase elongation subunit (family B)